MVTNFCFRTPENANVACLVPLGSLLMAFSTISKFMVALKRYVRVSQQCSPAHVHNGPLREARYARVSFSVHIGTKASPLTGQRDEPLRLSERKCDNSICIYSFDYNSDRCFSDYWIEVVILQAFTSFCFEIDLTL